jgi:release factor glutamine methyltransferase
VAGRVEWRAGEGPAPLAGAEYDVICSNPPYVPTSRETAMEPGVRDHVPRTAWDGGPDGLKVIRPLIEGSAQLVRTDGLLAIEIDASHHEEVRALAAAGPWREIRVLDDHEGHPRVLVAVRT